MGQGHLLFRIREDNKSSAEDSGQLLSNIWTLAESAGEDQELGSNILSDLTMQIDVVIESLP